jgi:hypothetical protein
MALTENKNGSGSRKVFIAAQPGQWFGTSNYHGSSMMAKGAPWPVLRNNLRSNRRWAVVLLPPGCPCPPDEAAIVKASCFIGPDEVEAKPKEFEAIEEAGATTMSDSQIREFMNQIKKNWGSTNYLSWNAKAFAIYLAYLINDDTSIANELLKPLRVALWSRLLFGVEFSAFTPVNIKQTDSYIEQFRDSTGTRVPPAGVLPIGFRHDRFHEVEHRVRKHLLSEKRLSEAIPELRPLI